MEHTRAMVGGTVALLLALLLSACGSNGGMAGMDHSQMGSATATTGAVGGSATATTGAVGSSATATADGMAGMDHSQMGSATATADGMAGMDHSQMGNSNAPYDAQFIDSMIEHHQGAITMAQQAQREAERPELKQLADTIIKDQEAEIAQMQQWRQQWFPDLAPTRGMGMDMGTMEVANDPNKPFDQRFIEAMIPHHEGAIAMAQDAQQKAERQEIKDLAGRIITAQEAEIAQMREWQQAWFDQ
jgi:uncharacterized protein (DUF305 family)